MSDRPTTSARAIPILTERGMRNAERRFPKLAAKAGVEAYRTTLRQTGGVTVKTRTGQVVERRRDDSITLITNLPLGKRVKPGTLRKRIKQSVAIAKAAPPAAQPRLRVLAGPNDSGKSTITPELKPQRIGAFVNAGEMEKDLKATQGFLSLRDPGVQDEAWEFSSASKRGRFKRGDSARARRRALRGGHPGATGGAQTTHSIRMPGRGHQITQERECTARRIATQRPQNSELMHPFASSPCPARRPPWRPATLKQSA